MTVLEALQQGDLTEFERLLAAVDDVDAIDADGWTPLSWAAGLGNREAVALLCARGANPLARGRDNRTPYLIALAAGHREAAAQLAEAERQHGGDPEGRSSRQAEHRVYCKAYPLSALRVFEGWPDREAADDDPVVFLHQDYSVTQSVLHGDPVLFAPRTAAWQTFCRDTLGFKVPADLDLLAGATR